jgi:phosphoglycolate phosphatase
LYLDGTDVDMQTADSDGVYAVGALWGFRTAESIFTSGARALVASPQDLLKFFSTTTETLIPAG